MPRSGATDSTDRATLRQHSNERLNRSQDQTPGQALSLVRAEELMRQNSPALRVAELALEASGADVATAGETPNPQLSLNSASIDYRNGIGAGAPWDKHADSILRIDQQLERGGKRVLRQKAARAGEQAALADYDDAQRSNRLALALAYFDLKLSQEAEGIAQNLVELQRQSLKAAQLRLKSGDVADVDVARLEIEAARANADFTAARTAKRDAQLVLAGIMGVAGQDSAFEASDDWPTPVTGNAANASIENRPDIRAAQARREQAHTAYDLARAQATRDITVGLQFERFPQPLGVSNTVGFGFSVPLFLRHRYQGEIQRAAVDRRSADATLRAAKLAAAADRELAATDIDGARERLQLFQSSMIAKAKATAESAEYAFRRGAVDLTDLLDARRAMQAVMLDALSAQAAYAKALAAWQAATDASAWTLSP